ncbi:hypothetical protein HHK36_026591 [Tetracentron sinense]|uniref:Classical arabinogalactan protein 26 n=1 Tax=Tetracentron sinense TaxID=13715 RepID=A0A834YFB6_TETSI|nr:hypothetical protein HHK36_026591 [Tetracentron sinense]
MDSFWFLLPLFVAFMISPSLSLSSSHLRLESYAISAAPALLPSSPISPSPNLSPDITPLFPSPGAVVVPSPTGSSSMPTIPSNPSPPNPDEMLAPGPDLAFSPSGSDSASSSAPLNIDGYPNSGVFVGLVVYCVMQLFGV